MIPTINIQQSGLSYNKESKTFYVEDSSLDVSLGEKVILRNQKTDKSTTFRFFRTVFNNDNEVTMWIYKSLDKSLTFKIFND